MNTPHTNREIAEVIKTDPIARSAEANGQSVNAERRARAVLDEQKADKVTCLVCKGNGQIPAGIDREAGRDPGRDCWKCHGYGEHIR